MRVETSHTSGSSKWVERRDLFPEGVASGDHMGGHGYSVAHAAPDTLSVEFVCIPRPIERSAGGDGRPLRYRVFHRAHLWQAGEKPVLHSELIEGEVGLST